MSISKQRELQEMRQQKHQKQLEYKNALKHLIHSQQTLSISLDYSQQYLKNNKQDAALEQYQPIYISRLIFDKELQAIKKQISKLPESRCKIEHFIIIMLKVMKFPFQKIPLYMVGLKDMFYEIIEEGKDTISYEDIFKYVLGELVTFHQQEQNTQFQVHFQQKKKQDYLLHDNGLKRVLYSSDMKLIMSLDQRDTVVKLYNEDMKNINRFTTKKELHQGRMPIIVDFDYSELTMRMGIIFADATIQSVHLHNFLNKSSSEFQSTTLNQLIFTMPEQMRSIKYIQMLNKWLTVSDQDNRVYLFDMEKIRLKPQQVLQKLSIDNNDLKISLVLQVVPLSTICFVAGNQITFYNQNLTEKKYSKFSHHQIINILKYCQQKNNFYLAGKEKSITIFTINRNQTIFKIWTLQINKIVTDIQIFPFFDTLLICDQSHELRLIHESSKTVYQQYSLSHIVKMKDKFLRSYKISKTQFMVHQTYMLLFNLQKIAIEKEMEFNFIPSYYYDSRKEQVYFSVNNQIISFSVLFGDIRKNYSLDTSNITRHQGFYIGPKTHLFILDSLKNIYEVYMKDQQVEGQNRNYRKTVAIGDIVAHFYDEQMRNFMVIGNNCVHQIRNDSSNNFNTINIIYLLDFPKITQAIFCNKTKYLTLMTSNQLIYQFRNFQTHLSKCFKPSFANSNIDLEDILFIQVEYCSEYQILILLNNKNQIAIVEKLKTDNHLLININQYLPFKLKRLNFNRFTYHLLKQKDRNQPSILLYDDTGYVIDIDLQKIFSVKFSSTLKEDRKLQSFLKESHDINVDTVKTQIIQFKPQNIYKLNTTDFILQKAHQKQIAIGIKLKIQVVRTLTIGKDGYIKLWNKSYDCLFILKIPLLLKIKWNMQQILKIKNQKSINEVLQIITKHYCVKDELNKPLEIVNKTKRQKMHIEPPKKIKQQPGITLEIDSKQIEDIVTHQQDYLKNYQISRGIRQKLKYNPEMTLTDSHPWRTKRQFVKILQRASPSNKYSRKIPKDLITLRTSLDMTERKKKTPNLKMAELVLPQLKTYQNQSIVTAEPQPKKQREEFENFESCLYIKSQRRPKRANDLDDIDRQFFRKAIEMQNRRWIPRYGKQKKSNTIDLNDTTQSLVQQSRYDAIKQVRHIFQEHNRQCIQTKRGRLINIPKIQLIRDYD